MADALYADKPINKVVKRVADLRDFYELEETEENCIGSGSFCKVFRAEHLDSGVTVAIKVIDKLAETYQGLREIICREITVLMDLPKNPNIMQCYEILETDEKLYIVCEYFPGIELFSLVKKLKKLPETTASHYFCRLIKTMKCLAEAGIAHRDIKAENILVKEDTDEIMLIDFGFSIKVKPGEITTGSCGSPLYAAPEHHTKGGYDPVKADIWSAGVLLYFMLCGYLPFFDEDLNVLSSLVIWGEYKIPSCVNPEAADLIRLILQTSAEERPDFETILSHPWMKVRKLFSKKSIILDWNKEYLKIEEDTLKELAQTVLGYDNKQLIFDIEDEQQLLEKIKDGSNPRLTTLFNVVFAEILKRKANEGNGAPGVPDEVDQVMSDMSSEEKKSKAKSEADVYKGGSDGRSKSDSEEFDLDKEAADIMNVDTPSTDLHGGFRPYKVNSMQLDNLGREINGKAFGYHHSKTLAFVRAKDNTRKKGNSSMHRDTSLDHRIIRIKEQNSSMSMSPSFSDFKSLKTLKDSSSNEILTPTANVIQVRPSSEKHKKLYFYQVETETNVAIVPHRHHQSESREHKEWEPTSLNEDDSAASKAKRTATSKGPVLDCRPRLGLSNLALVASSLADKEEGAFEEKYQEIDRISESDEIIPVCIKPVTLESRQESNTLQEKIEIEVDQRTNIKICINVVQTFKHQGWSQERSKQASKTKGRVGKSNNLAAPEFAAADKNVKATVKPSKFSRHAFEDLFGRSSKGRSRLYVENKSKYATLRDSNFRPQIGVNFSARRMTISELATKPKVSQHIQKTVDSTLKSYRTQKSSGCATSSGLLKLSSTKPSALNLKQKTADALESQSKAEEYSPQSFLRPSKSLIAGKRQDSIIIDGCEPTTEFTPRGLDMLTELSVENLLAEIKSIFEMYGLDPYVVIPSYLGQGHRGMPVLTHRPRGASRRPRLAANHPGDRG